jgi:hypothetical protein
MPFLENPMKKLALFPILAFALVGCADQPDLVGPHGINADLQPTSENVWFVTDPPEPALVGETYDVEIGSFGGGMFLSLTSLTPSVCSVFITGGDGLTELYGTISFLEAGDCTLEATDFIDYVYQIFPVYEPDQTPDPVTKTCTLDRAVREISFEISVDRDCPPGWS